MTDLSGQVALVTGAARGQGRSHAVALARAGARLVLVDIASDISTIPYPLGTAAELRETEAMVQEAGQDCLSFVADIRDTTAMTNVVDTALATFGRLDICVANAGVVAFGRFWELTDDQWCTMVDTNLNGAFKTVRAVVPHMLERNYGRIIIVSSMSGRMGNANLAHYVASKWGLIGMAKSLAIETAGNGITVNALCPTSVDTPMLHNPAMYSLFCPDIEQPTRDDVAPRYAAMNKLGRPWLSSEEVSHALLYLCDANAAAVTGQAIEVSMGSASGQH
ncbi:MAG: mycofactocin-coupled SDR family oxidoreductase [Ilumatobacteraceae bacterium]|jgi:SDR family mycofactocin-dependent oxidoreductase|nr:mycofactocin-coupled SDR family oxidoreductase [Ilumatobacteraceae bacterium]